MTLGNRTRGVEVFDSPSPLASRFDDNSFEDRNLIKALPQKSVVELGRGQYHLR